MDAFFKSLWYKLEDYLTPITIAYVGIFVFCTVLLGLYSLTVLFGWKVVSALVLAFILALTYLWY